MSLNKKQKEEKRNIESKIRGEKKYLDQLIRIDTYKAWEMFQEKTETSTINKIPRFAKLRWNKSIYKYAAAILLILISSFAVYHLSIKPVYRYEITDSGNKQTEITLPDGSKIILNKASTLYSPGKFRANKRVVKLEGEAYFDIIENDNSPFYVKLDNTTIEVLGTSFTIKEEKNKRVKVHVLSGKVLFFDNKNRENSLTLTKGQAGTFASKTGMMEESVGDSEEFLFWESKIKTFIDVALLDVFRQFEISFNTHIIVENKELLQQRLTSDFTGQSIDEILEELSLLFNLSFRKDNDTIFIKSVNE